jgi:hypothetical protein
MSTESQHDQYHPDESRDAPPGQQVDLNIEIEAQDRRQHQQDVLRHPQIDQRPDHPRLLGRPTGPHGGQNETRRQ